MDENELLELSGTVDSVIYKNEENGYTVIDRGRGARQHTLRKLGLELPAVDAVRHPVAADDHGFAGRGVREAADDRHSLAVFVSHWSRL